MSTKWIITLLSVGFFISLVGCMVFAYLWIDRSITLAYVNQDVETSNNAMRHLELLLEGEWRGIPENNILQKLELAAARNPNKKILIKKDGEVIWFDNIQFNFESGRFKKIER